MFIAILSMDTVDSVLGHTYPNSFRGRPFRFTAEHKVIRCVRLRAAPHRPRGESNRLQSCLIKSHLFKNKVQHKLILFKYQ